MVSLQLEHCTFEYQLPFMLADDILPRYIDDSITFRYVVQHFLYTILVTCAPLVLSGNDRAAFELLIRRVYFYLSPGIIMLEQKPSFSGL